MSNSADSTNGAAEIAATPGLNEEDEEVRLAMEMAMAAAKHPHLKPDELRKLVGEKNKQYQLVSEVEVKVQKKREEQAAAEWEEKKQRAYQWWTNKAAEVAQTAENLKWEAEKQFYAEEIKQDEIIIKIRKRMKLYRKILKTHRLSGNRVETRHAFKRQRMEKKLLFLNDKLKKQQKVLTHSSFNVQEYAKAMMKASKKWKKKGSKEELSLEAQLCRNMHQMLAIEKQKAKLHKSAREIKKYLQRCKSWLSDKKAFCEMHIMTLDATASSMRYLYQDTLSRHDALIRRMRALEEFRNVDFSDVDLSSFNNLEATKGPSGMLNALRGLPISDSVRLKKEDLEKMEEKAKAEEEKRMHPELYVEVNDDGSVSSHLTDPDSGEKEVIVLTEDIADEESDEDTAWGDDAPWIKEKEEDDSDSEEEKKVVVKKEKKKKSAEGEVKEAPPSSTTDDVDNDKKASGSSGTDKTAEPSDNVLDGSEENGAGNVSDPSESEKAAEE